jgi:hypothetical protein
MATDIHQTTLSNIAAFNALVASNPPAALQDLFIASLQVSIAQVEEVQEELESNPGSVLQELLDKLNEAICACGLCKQLSNPQAA